MFNMAKKALIVIAISAGTLQGLNAVGLNPINKSSVEKELSKTTIVKNVSGERTAKAISNIDINFPG